MNIHYFLPIMKKLMYMQKIMTRKSKCSIFPDGSDTTTTTKTEQYHSKISWLSVIISH